MEQQKARIKQIIAKKINNNYKRYGLTKSMISKKDKLKNDMKG
jgi:hypothetical protein